MSTNKTPKIYEDRKVNVKIKIALLWVALMFFYIYNDIFSLFQPGHVADLVEGQLEGIQFTQTILFSAAILMAIPSIMILLSLTLNAKVNRILNIFVAVLHILVLLGTQFVGKGETWFYWRFYELLEILLLAIIIWTAWKWPHIESQHQ